MTKMITLNTMKRHYHKKLDHFVASASVQEINEFVNTIHRGSSSQGCGIWLKELSTFTSCDNENCQMLSECLEVNATVRRHEFFTFVFDGNTEQEKITKLKKKIAHEYYQLLSPHVPDDIFEQFTVAYQKTYQEHLLTTIDFSSSMKQKLPILESLLPTPP